MSAVGRVTRSAVARRRVQTIVIVLTTMVAVTSAVVAGSLMVAASSPFDRSFTAQHGAHLTAQFDPAKASAEQVKETGQLAGVTASAGPFPSIVIQPVDERGGHPPALTLVGRSNPRSEVDELDLKSGRWAEKRGEIVLSAAFAGPPFEIGSILESSDGADSQALTVVGFAVSATDSADAWTTPEQVTSLTSDGNPITSQMLYRFDSAETKKQIATISRTLRAAVPFEALLGTESWLDARRAANQNAAPTIPFLIAFGLIGIVMSVIIISSVISGSVGTHLRRIGILKAIGFTPGEVVRAYITQALIPASIGITLGVVLGNLLALPLLHDTESVYGTASLSVAWWVDVMVAGGALLIVGIAALIPALRAGKLRTVDAISIGRAPRPGQSQWAHRALARLPLPRSVSYGLATGFAHPIRALAMLLAVVFGTLTATFSLGLTASLNAVGEAQDPEDRAAVTVFAGAPNTNPSASDIAKVRAAIEAEPGTASYYGKTQAQISVLGSASPMRAELYQGDVSAGSYEMIAGHWIEDVGQVVVASGFLNKTGMKIGDSVRVMYAGETQTLRIVGEAFDTSDGGTRIHAHIDNFATAKPAVYLVTLKSGISGTEYAEKLTRVLQPLGGAAMASSPSQQERMILILDAMAASLTLMLVAVAALGVLNSVVLDTRERIHDLGVCKAIGMPPRHIISLVLASVTGIGILGGLIGVPLGYALHGFVLPVMGRAADTNLPPSILDVYTPVQLVLLGLAGLVIAMLGAMLPASWAAKTRAATALRTE
ncbi:MAG: ABC transporter permease [Corynebacteriales bacterium]|nr:ABC transporter permease [Mycobacteriales bacterium]